MLKTLGHTFCYIRAMSKIKELLCVSEEDVRNVRRAFNKTEEDIKEDVNLMLEWLNKQPHLPQPHDRVRLEMFLLRNKFRIEKTKIKLDNYYSFKVFYPDFYININLDLAATQNVKKSAIVVPMPKLLPTLERIIFCKAVENQEECFNFVHTMAYMIMIWELRLFHDYSAGTAIICDLRYMTLKHVIKMDINALHKTMLILQHGYSDRLLQIHYVSESPVIGLLVNMMKRVLSAKIFGRIRVHKTFDSLHEFISKDYLPEDAGGNLSSIKDIAEKWHEEVVLQNEFLKENLHRKSNEKLRIGKPIHNDLFGLDGTFKKINLD